MSDDDQTQSNELLDPKDLLDSFLHSFVHGMFLLANNLKYVLQTLEVRPLSHALSLDNTIMRALQAASFEATAQLFEAQKILAALHPESAFGFGRPQIREVSPETILREMLPEYNSVADQRGVEIVLEGQTFKETMPKIHVEVTAIRRMFHNLLMNAIKYSFASTTRSRRTIVISFQRHTPDGQFWVMRIKNYGVGVEPDEIPMLFQPFYRGRKARAEGVLGQGLGLYDVKLCMEHHGGRVMLTSRSKGGGAFLTTVSLVFPTRTSIR